MKMRLTAWIAWGLVLFVALALSTTIIPGLLKAKERQRRIQVILDLQMLTLSARIYANNNAGSLPAPGMWCDQLVSPVGTNKEPALDPGALEQLLARTSCGFAINAMVAGRKLETISSNDIIFFPVIKRGRNHSASLQEIDAVAWDKHGVVEVLDVGNVKRKLNRTDSPRN